MIREKKKTGIKKIATFMMCTMLLIVGMGYNDYTSVYAATDSEDHGFEIDENLFNVNWQETSQIKVYQTADTNNSYFKKGTCLGYTKVYTGFATTKKQIDGKYYQRVLVQADMVPLTVSGSNKGMAQYLTIQVENAPRMKNKDIEPDSTFGSTSYSTTGSTNFGGNMGLGDNGVEVGGELSFGIESSCSYTENALRVITNKDDNGYATWEYDYISSKTSKEQNAYLFGSSEQRGLFMWNMEKNYNGFYAALQLKVTATFGGGNVSTNVRAQARNTGANNLGSASTEKKIIWN